MSKYTNKDLLSHFGITLQFYIKDGRTDMLLTTNDYPKLDWVSMKLHGEALAENNTQLESKDHEALQAFCRSYLENSGYNVR